MRQRVSDGAGEAPYDEPVPKIVDHDARRREVVDVAYRVVAADGVEALTMRRLADEMGLSNGALARYFPSKAEIVGAAMQRAIDESIARFEAAGGDGLRGAAGLRAFCYEAFPFEEITRVEALVVVPFFQFAQHDAALRAIWEDYIDGWTPRLRRMIDEMVEDGEARADVDHDQALDLLFTAVSGAQANPLLSPARGTRERLDGLVEALLRSLS